MADYGNSLWAKAVDSEKTKAIHHREHRRHREKKISISLKNFI
jgi:hypothetical protein